MNETWKDAIFYEQDRIISYAGLYQVSDQGRIRSLDRYVTRGNHIVLRKGLILSSTMRHSGYLGVKLSSGGKTISRRVHRLVYETFKGQIKHQLDHLNGDKHDNRLINLQDVTCRENITRYHKRNKNKASKYTGVYPCSNSENWRSSIKIGKEERHLGVFHTELEAHEAYQKALDRL